MRMRHTSHTTCFVPTVNSVTEIGIYIHRAGNFGEGSTHLLTKYTKNLLELAFYGLTSVKQWLMSDF